MAKMTLDQLVEQLRKAFGDALRAVVLYGSAIAGEHIARRSDYNVLVLVDRFDIEQLMREAAIARSWAEAGHPPPLTLTTTEWYESVDVFPMEYADVLERHRVLYGTLPTDNISVNPRDLRIQLERESRGKLLQLRAGVLSAGGDGGRLVELLAASLSTFMVIFRALLRLHGETPDTDYEALARQVAARTGISVDPFLRVIRHVRGGDRIATSDVTRELAGYLESARQLAEYVDHMGAT